MVELNRKSHVKCYLQEKKTEIYHIFNLFNLSVEINASPTAAVSGDLVPMLSALHCNDLFQLCCKHSPSFYRPSLHLASAGRIYCRAVFHSGGPRLDQHFPLCPWHLLSLLHVHELITPTLTRSVAFTSPQNRITTGNQTDRRESSPRIRGGSRRRMDDSLHVLLGCVDSTL